MAIARLDPISLPCRLLLISAGVAMIYGYAMSIDSTDASIWQDILGPTTSQVPPAVRRKISAATVTWP